MFLLLLFFISFYSFYISVDDICLCYSCWVLCSIAPVTIKKNKYMRAFCEQHEQQHNDHLCILYATKIQTTNLQWKSISGFSLCIWFFVHGTQISTLSINENLPKLPIPNWFVCIHIPNRCKQMSAFFRFNRNICIWLNCRFFCRFCVELTYADHLNFLSNNYISIGKKKLNYWYPYIWILIREC